MINTTKCKILNFKFLLLSTLGFTKAKMGILKTSKKHAKINPTANVKFKAMSQSFEYNFTACAIKPKDTTKLNKSTKIIKPVRI